MVSGNATLQPVYRKRTGLLATVLLLAGLLAACGSDNNNNDQAAVSAAPGSAPAATALASTPVATSPKPETTASATTVPATTAAPAPTTARATTTAAAAATVAATTTRPANTVAALTTAAVATTAAARTPDRAPIGNSYPAGPAPTAGLPAGGLVEVTLQVPEQFKKGNFAQPRKLKLLPGFSISLYSVHGSDLRFGAFSPDGRLFVSERGAGRIVFVKENNGVGEPQTFASGLNGPHGVAFHKVDNQIYLYVAENDKVTRFAYQDGQTSGAQKEVIVRGLPTGAGHSTRSIAFGPDGKMYISVGSSCNVCEEADPRRAAVVQYNADGTGERLFARGLRNEVGIMFHPETGELWGTENSRDNLGSNPSENNDIPPEEINIIRDGADYGWPYCYSNQLYDSQYGRKNSDYCKQTIPPALPMQAHSAPLGMDFYLPKTMQFPADYRGDLFVGFHGSWNRSPATGYKVVRIRVKEGRPVSYEDFATGWLVDSSARGYWGRPVAPVVGPDGSLFVTDDVANVVYRISYRG